VKLDGYITCERCGASAHDAIDERKGEVLAECCFCGATEWCKAPRRPTAKPIAEAAAEADEFRFKFGRFAGMTLAEADAKPNGRKYLEWMVTNNDKLRDTIAAYLKRSTVSEAASIVQAASVANPCSGE
jgi:hypothetical protein